MDKIISDNIFLDRLIVGEEEVGFKPQIWNITKDTITTKLLLEPPIINGLLLFSYFET